MNQPFPSRRIPMACLVVASLFASEEFATRLLADDKAAHAEIISTMTDAWQDYATDYPLVVCDVTQYLQMGNSRDEMERQTFRETDLDDRYTMRHLLEGLHFEGYGERAGVYAANSDYEFEIDAPGSPEQQLESVSVWDEDAFQGLELRLAGRELNGPGQRASYALLRGISLLPGTLPYLMDQPGFAVTSLEMNNGLAEMEFSFEPADDVLFLRQGRIVLDPDQYWLIQSFKTESSNGYCERIYTYSDFQGVPLVAEIHEWRDMGANVGIGHLRTTYDWRKPTDEDGEMLYLTYYGLPEPELMKDHSGRWMIIVGTLLLFTGVIWWLVRRTRKAQAA